MPALSKLYKDALRLSINENLRNIRLLLEWAENADQMADTIQHTEQAFRLLGEVVENLRALDASPGHG